MADKFYYVEGNTSVKNLIKTLATEITKNAELYKWDLVYPESLEKIGASIEKQEIDLITDGSETDKVQTKFNVNSADDKCIIKATTSFGKEFFVKFYRVKADLTTEEKEALIEFRKLHSYYVNQATYHRTDAEVLELMAGVSKENQEIGKYNAYVSAMTKSNSINNIRLQIASELNEKGDDLNISQTIQNQYDFRLSWYRHLQPEIKEWLPVEYWLNITKDSINIVLEGDNSADVHPYHNYLVSYAYIGALKPIEDSALTDDEYNFGITVSSDVEPRYSHIYGESTATGITDICMIGNKIGMPYQPHYPAFYTTNPFMDKCNTKGSRYNHGKRAFDDITVVHSKEMERGKMINVIAGDASSINDTDRLILDRGTEKETHYKKFKITAPFSFMNNSPNPNYCIAIKCYKTVE